LLLDGSNQAGAYSFFGFTSTARSCMFRTMGVYRFHSESIDKGKPVTELDGPEAHHLRDVLRLSCGDTVELFDGRGVVAVATVTAINKTKVTLQVDDLRTYRRRTSGRIILAASIAKGERFDWLISKCTELGVDHIKPVIFERTVKLARNPNLHERWHKLAISAVKQCGRAFLPQIDAPVALPEALADLKRIYPNAAILVGSPGQEATPLVGTALAGKDIIAFVGPEGGLNRDEEVLVHKAGGVGICLNDNVLRVETAAVAFAAILCWLRETKKKG